MITGERRVGNRKSEKKNKFRSPREESYLNPSRTLLDQEGGEKGEY